MCYLRRECSKNHHPSTNQIENHPNKRTGREKQVYRRTNRGAIKESSKVGEVQSKEPKGGEMQSIRRTKRGRSAINQTTKV